MKVFMKRWMNVHQSFVRLQQCFLLNASSSMCPPQCVPLMTRPHQCVLLNASSSMRPPLWASFLWVIIMSATKCILKSASSIWPHYVYIIISTFEVRILRSVLLHRMLIMLPANKMNPFNCNKDYRPRVSIYQTSISGFDVIKRFFAFCPTSWICLVLNCLNVNFFILQH